MYVTVYRVENVVTGMGPYVSHDYHKSGNIKTVLSEMIEVHCNPDTHPAWCFDFYERNGSAYLSGFTSLEKLHAWFGEYLPAIMSSRKYRIKELQVPEEYVVKSISGKQCQFNSNKIVSERKLKSTEYNRFKTVASYV